MKPLALARLKYTPLGGAENYLLRLCGSLESQGASFRILSTNWKSDNAVPIFAPKFLPSFLKALLFSYGVCKKKRKEETLLSLERIPCADVYRAGDGVHKAYIKSRKEAGESAFKIYLNPLNIVYLALEKAVLKNSRLIIANSLFVKNDIMRYYDVAGEKIEVVYNGVNQNSLVNDAANTDSVRAEFGLREGEKLILFVGSGYKRKGVSEFLELLGALLPSSYKAVVVGKEKNMSFYKAKARELGVNVFFAGARSDVDRLYAAADIFLFPTRYEPFSNVCLEAMAGGCAVITTAQNGACEILEPDFIMKNPQDSGVVKIIKALIEDEAFLTEAKSANLAKSAEYSVEKNMLATLEALKKL